MVLEGHHKTMHTYNFSIQSHKQQLIQLLMKHFIFSSFAFLALLCFSIDSNAQSVRIENYIGCDVQVELAYNCNNCVNNMNNTVSVSAGTTSIFTPPCPNASLFGFSMNANGKTSSPFATTYDCNTVTPLGTITMPSCSTKVTTTINWDMSKPYAVDGNYVIEIVEP